MTKKWRAYGTVFGTKNLGEFEADSEEEAKEKAINSDECYVGFCHHCAKQCEDPEIYEVDVEEIKDD